MVLRKVEAIQQSQKVQNVLKYNYDKSVIESCKQRLWQTDWEELEKRKDHNEVKKTFLKNIWFSLQKNISKRISTDKPQKPLQSLDHERHRWFF